MDFKIASIKRLIWRKVLEIIIAFALILISIPIWILFKDKFQTANITTLEDYHLDFDVKLEKLKDTLIVKNEYHMNKNYNIYLVLDRITSEDKVEVILNNIKYPLQSFYKNNINNSYKIVSDSVSGDTKTYDIALQIDGEEIDCSYIFEEFYNF